jgi:phage-related protein
MKDKIKQAISAILSAMKNAWPWIRNITGRSYGICKIIYNAVSQAIKWLYHVIADMFRKVPSELTYWHDGALTIVHVDDFVEIAPNLIQYEDSATGKRVKVKAEYPIKYILKEK